MSEWQPISLALALYVHAGPTARAVEGVAWRACRGETDITPPRSILLANRPRFDMCLRIANRALQGALPEPPR